MHTHMHAHTACTRERTHELESELDEGGNHQGPDHRRVVDVIPKVKGKALVVEEVQEHGRQKHTGHLWYDGNGGGRYGGGRA